MMLLSRLSIDQTFSFLPFLTIFEKQFFFIYIPFHYLNAGIKNSTRLRAFRSLYLCILPSYTLRIVHRKIDESLFSKTTIIPGSECFISQKSKRLVAYVYIRIYVYLHNLFNRTRQIKMFFFYLNQIGFSVQYLITSSSNTTYERFRYAKRWTLDTVSVGGNEQR